MSKDNIEEASSPEEQCQMCLKARAVMQVAPCGHISQCRLCFVHTIQRAVANRDLPLKCLLCNTKILKVKNNSNSSKHQEIPVHTSGHQMCANNNNKLPKSASGYSIGSNNMAHSNSNYSMSSGISSMSASSCGSVKSISSIKSNHSNSSWFSIGSLSNFQSEKVTVDSSFLNKPPRAHSLSSSGKSRPKLNSLASSSSQHSLKSWNSTHSNSQQQLNPNASNAQENSHKEIVVQPTPSPTSIDNRIRALQGYIKVQNFDPDEAEGRQEEEKEACLLLPNQNSIPRSKSLEPHKLNPKTRLQMTRENFRRSKSYDGGSNNSSPPGQISKPVSLRRLNFGDKSSHHRRYPKSPDLMMAETTFTMTTIEEENEITNQSLKNLAQIED